MKMNMQAKKNVLQEIIDLCNEELGKSLEDRKPKPPEEKAEMAQDDEETEPSGNPFARQDEESDEDKLKKMAGRFGGKKFGK